MCLLKSLEHYLCLFFTRVHLSIYLCCRAFVASNSRWKAPLSDGLVTLYLVEDRGAILLLLINVGLSVLVDFGRGRAFLVSLCVKLSSRRSSASSNKHISVTRASDHWATHAHKLCLSPHWERLGGFDLQINHIYQRRCTGYGWIKSLVFNLVRLNTLQEHTALENTSFFREVIYFHCGIEENPQKDLHWWKHFSFEPSLSGWCLTSQMADSDFLWINLKL